MKKKHLFAFLLAAFVISCQSENNSSFLIAKAQVGPLTKDSQVRALDSIFAKDSVVIQKKNNMFEKGTEVVIFDKNGAVLLRLEPVQSFDSTSTIGNIEIIDPRYKTKTGVGISSTFKDLVANYTISRIENSLNSLIVFIDEINVYITLKKENLPASLRNRAGQPIKVGQIPDSTKISHFWIDWQ